MQETNPIRAMQEFVSWYEAKLVNISLSPSLAFDLNEFQIKFKYILKKDEEENIMMGKLLG
jgi:hypothetical protein